MLTAGYSSALPYSETFAADQVIAILSQSGCVGFRAYLGMKEDNSVCLIFTGVDSAGNSIVGLQEVSSEGLLLDDGQRCPPVYEGLISLEY